MISSTCLVRVPGLGLDSEPPAHDQLESGTIGKTADNTGTRGVKRKERVDFCASEEEKNKGEGLFRHYPVVPKDQWLEIEHEKTEKYREASLRAQAAADIAAEKKAAKQREASRIRSRNYRNRKKEVR